MSAKYPLKHITQGRYSRNRYYSIIHCVIYNGKINFGNDVISSISVLIGVLTRVIPKYND